MRRFFRWLTYLVILLVTVPLLGYGIALLMKPKIRALIEEQIKNNVKGEVHIGDLDFTVFEQFPELSITVSDVYLRGPKNVVYQHDFFSAKKIYIHAQPVKLLKGKVNLKSITIRDGNIFIFRTKNNYSNLEIFRKQDTAVVRNDHNLGSLAVENILFEDTRFLYFDSARRKSYGVRFVRTRAEIGQSDTSRIISLKGSMYFLGLMLNEKRGSFLKDKPADVDMNLEYVPAHDRLTIASSSLTFKESKVMVSGLFNFKDPGTFHLSVSSDALNYAEALTIVTASLRDKLGKYSCDAPLILSLQMNGILAQEASPKVDVVFSTIKNHVVIGTIDVNDVAFKGSFTNHLDESRLSNDKNSMLNAEAFSGRIKGIPVNANFRISNLSDPEWLISATTKMNLVRLNEEVDVSKVKFLLGTAAANIHYDGKLKKFSQRENPINGGKLSGTIDIQNAGWEVVLKEKNFKNTNAHLSFDQKNLEIENFSTNVNGNVVDIKGTVEEFIPFLLEPKRKGSIKLSVRAAKIDLATLAKKKTRKGKPTTRGNPDLAAFVDQLYSKVNFDINLLVDELRNGPMHATKVSGKLKLADNAFTADPVSMRLAGGTILTKLRITNLDKEINPVYFDARVREADIKSLFAAFRNFSQKGITSNHISGKVSATIIMRARIDDKFNLIMPTMRGTVDLMIRKGRIRDYPPLEKMSNFLFKSRDFSDVQFAEIRSHFQIVGKTFYVRRMEVESSVLKMFLEGRYSLAGDTDLSIQVPLSNLKKRKKDYKPENVGTHAKLGPSIYLRAHQKDGSLVIAYDPLKKFKKK